MCTRLYICVPARTYVYLIAHICTFWNICVLNCTYVYSKVWLFVHKLLVLKLYIITGNLLCKTTFLGTPKYLVKNKCILLRFAKKRLYIELWYFIQVNLNNYSSMQDIKIHHYLSRFIIVLGIP